MKVTITGTGSEMQGVARLEDGRAVFVPFALPGEEVEIAVTKLKDRFALAKLERVLTQSSCRTQPDCPYYGVCGGCQTRHMTYESALELKREKVLAALRRLGGLENPEVLPTLPSPGVNGYRNKAEFACADGRIGVYKEGSSEVVDIDACLLQPDSVNRLIGLIRPRMNGLALSGVVTRVNSAGEIMLIFCTPKRSERLSRLAGELMSLDGDIKSVYACEMPPQPAHALDGECVHLAGLKQLDETICGLRFSVSPKSFFQINRPAAERLYDTALAFARLGPDDTVCDLYCGTGTISLCAAKHCKSVTGIELVPEAIGDAHKNAEANGMAQKTVFHCADAARAYPPLSRRQSFGAVFVDPPRKGLDRAVIDALLSSPTPRLIYVSCDPATLARDIKLLTQSGTYRFIKAQPVDMFPGTSHVKTVVLMSRKDT